MLSHRRRRELEERPRFLQAGRLDRFANEVCAKKTRPCVSHSERGARSSEHEKRRAKARALWMLGRRRVLLLLRGGLGRLLLLHEIRHVLRHHLHHGRVGRDRVGSHRVGHVGSHGAGGRVRTGLRAHGGGRAARGELGLVRRHLLFHQRHLLRHRGLLRSARSRCRGRRRHSRSHK